jgi:hypothetical protein
MDALLKELLGRGFEVTQEDGSVFGMTTSERYSALPIANRLRIAVSGIGMAGNRRLCHQSAKNFGKQN